MQKLVFKNGNGVEIDLTDGEKYGITDWSGLSNTDLNIQTQTVPFADGAVYLDALLGEKDIAVTIAVNDGGDLETRYELKRELIALLNPKLGEGVLTYTNDYLSKQITVVPQLPVFANKNIDTAGTLKASVAFTACIPYWEDTEETEVLVSDTAYTTVTNSGDVPLRIKAEVYPFNNNSVTIENKTNDTVLTLDGDINAPVSVDMNVGAKTVLKESISADNTFMAPFKIAKFNNRIFGIYGSSLYVTDDGEKWDFVYNFGNALIGLCATSDSVVVYNANDKILYFSSDLETWTEISMSSYATSGLYLSYNVDNSTTFLLCSDCILYSTDLTTWSQIATDNPPVYATYLVTLDKTITDGTNNYVCIYIDNNGYLYGVQEDLETVDVLYDSYEVGCFYYDDELDIFVMYASGLKYSTDLTTWTDASFSVSFRGQIIKYRNCLYLFSIGGYQYYAISNDGKNWSAVNLSYSYNNLIVFKDDLLAFGNYYYWSFKKGNYNIRLGIGNATLSFGENTIDTDKCIMTISGGVAYRSPDGIEWVVGGNCGTTTNCLLKVGERIIQGSDEGMIYYTDDCGTTFQSLQVVSGDYSISAISYSEERGVYLIACTNNLFYESSDDLATATYVTSFGNAEIDKIIVVPISDEEEKYFLVTQNGSYIYIKSYKWEDETYTSYRSQLAGNYTSGDILDGFYDSVHDNVIVQAGDTLYSLLKASNPLFGIAFAEVTSDYSFDFTISYKDGRGFYTIVESDGLYYIAYSNDGSNWALLEQVPSISSCFYSFLFKTFISRVGTTGYFNWVFSADENIINSLIEFDLTLDVGDNELTVVPTDNLCFIRLTYRNRYIGV